MKLDQVYITEANKTLIENKLFTKFHLHPDSDAGFAVYLRVTPTNYLIDLFKNETSKVYHISQYDTTNGVQLRVQLIRQNANENQQSVTKFISIK